MEIELRKELFSAAEEEYVSKGYSYEESIEYFQKRYSDAACLAERVNDGEIVDNTNLRFNIEQLIISFKYANQKRQDIGSLARNTVRRMLAG